MITEFKLWLPEGVGKPKALVVLTPPSQSDGRGDVNDPEWQAFATKHGLGLVGCFFQDDVPTGIEQYCDMSHVDEYGLCTGFRLTSFIERKFGWKHPKLLLWGFSAGGQFNYEFTARYPEDVAAFVVNKGGIYYTALASEKARKVPGLFIVGSKDALWRQNILYGIYGVNRIAGCDWSLKVEDTGHSEGKSKAYGMELFEHVLEGVKV